MGLAIGCATIWLASAAATLTQGPPGNRPAGETRKHLQLLRDVPDAQLFLAMNFVAQSLGVNCDYCHVNAGKDPKTGNNVWLWERDDKPQKADGLRMIRLVREINDANYQGVPVVTCFTCHRGSRAVSAVPPLPPPDLAAIPTANGTPLPPAAAILAAYLKAVGGADAIAHVETLVLRGSDERSASRQSTIEITMKGSDKLLFSRTSPDQGAAVQAISGATGWLRAPNVARTLAPADVEQVRRIAVVYAPNKVAEDASRLRVVGTDRIGEREAYVVATEGTAEVNRRYLFDRATGLLVRRVTLTRTPFVALPEQVDFEDYRDVGGIRLPFVIRTSNIAYFDTAVRRFAEIRLNVPVDDRLFEPR